MATAPPADYLGFLRAEWCRTTFLEFRLDGALVAVAVTDLVGDGLSAVYTFFDPSLAGRSLGTLAILKQIESARSQALPYLYLGYWIRDSRKMAYKVDFRPIELWRNGQWQRLNPDQPLPE
jgi:arginine-tRNA-protein transferase